MAPIATIVADLRSSPAIAAAPPKPIVLAVRRRQFGRFPGSTAKTSLLGLLTYVVERTH